ncbi:MAG: hypothetical protein NT116_02530 [Candidatus Parcubacteria bacterium]|nr:hypothetical protein [Candidatus Parcubacteria bacterium]
MFNFAGKKYSKAIILLSALIFGFASICGVLLFIPQPVLAQPGVPVVPPVPLPTTNLFLELTQANYSASEAARYTFLKSLDDTTSYFSRVKLAAGQNCELNGQLFSPIH